MRFLLRADAGFETGTGHVMRCLTIAEELVERGHQVELRGALGGIQWLGGHIANLPVRYEETPSAEVDADRIAAEGWGAMVVDSYLIDPADIARVNHTTPVLAVIDGDDRGIEARSYLDQNLGAEDQPRPPAVARAILAGSRYSLVRHSVRSLRRPDRWRLPSRPTVLAFMGGSDPVGAMQHVAGSLMELPSEIELTLVTAPPWQASVRALTAPRANTRIVDPTMQLPELLASADIVVSATGTSAAEICTIGLPAVFAAVVENQQAGLSAIVRSGVALGIDGSSDLSLLSQTCELVEVLLASETSRRELVEKSLLLFDGGGASRVADALEQLATTG